MGHRELIESLRKDGEESINRLWSEVKAEAEKIEEEASRNVNELREKYGRKQESVIRQQEDAVLAEARNRARSIKLKAERALSERLFPIAESSLGALRNAAEYNEVFKLLVRELPDRTWDEVQVNPRDADITREHFPGARITGDDAVAGGFRVLRAEGKICIANTFKNRLEKAWEDLLPVLINAIYEEISSHESSPET
ncbi:MAG: V-type ATP synthase subunit E [Nitrospiraceae bacterium]|nr:MAG: V-type ATP synthase subunit E [Nitrospiraceae bacterium]